MTKKSTRGKKVGGKKASKRAKTRTQSKTKTSRKKSPLRTPVAQVVVPTPRPLSHGARDAANDRSVTRFEAGLLYVTSMHNVDIPALRRDPRFSDVSPVTLSRWRRADRWDDRRKAMFLDIGEELERRIKSSITDTRFMEVQSTTSLRNTAIDQLMETDVDGNRRLKARSWEGVARVLLNANKRLAEIYDDVRGDIVADKAESATPEQRETAFEYDEDALRRAAKLLTAERREKIREDLAAPKTVDAEGQSVSTEDDNVA